jgi:hypothetical protein
MKYHLDTIPVWDAYHQEDECPLCLLESKAEKSYIEFFLSGSVMEPDTRVEVNKTGFCPSHFSMLYQAQNRLGLALITHTHFNETLDKLKRHSENILKNAQMELNTSLPASILRKAKGKDNPLLSSIEQLSKWLVEHGDDCMVCNRIQVSLERYAYTILHLWDNDKEFNQVLLNSKGFCLPHLSIIMKIARETLSPKSVARWVSDIMPVEIKNLERLEKELLWFTQKFDYRNQDKPWGNSKDALPRTVQKLTSKYMESQNE